MGWDHCGYIYAKDWRCGLGGGRRARLGAGGGGGSRGAKLRRELCESRGGRPGLIVPNKPDGFCGRKVTPKRKRGKWCRGWKGVGVGVQGWCF